MILAIIFAQAWGVIQLIVLTSLARTVRARTALAAMAVGFYAIGPITAFLQLSWIRLAALLLGKSISDLTGVASYTVDPFVEELMKLLPLALLMVIPAIRRQWSVTDCLLIGAATGSGFGLTEHLFRYADYASTAESVSGGYALTTGIAIPLVPGIARSLTSWLPLGVFFEGNAVRINWHLAWSAIGGLAVGMFLRYPKRAARLTALGLFILIGLEHAAGNARGTQMWLSWLATPFRMLDSALWLLVLIAIAVAWWLDQPLQRAGRALGPLLAAEKSAPSQLSGTLTAALSRLPWSIPWVCGFDRARRAYQAARAASPDGRDELGEAMVAQRDIVDHKLTQPISEVVLPASWAPVAVMSNVRSALRRPPVIIWLLLLAPSVLYLIIGGFPAASGLQGVMKGPFVWPLVLLITILGQARMAWRVLSGIRKLPAAARLPIGDDAAILGLQLACGVGTLSLAGFTLARVISGVGAGERMLSSAHAADAINRAQPAGGAAEAGSGGAFDPPPASPDLPEGPADAAAAAAAAAGAAGAAAGGDAASGDESSSDGEPGDAPDGATPGHDSSESEAAAERAANEAPAANAGNAASDAAAAQAEAAASQADADAAEASRGQPGPDAATQSSGGAFDPPPPSLDLPDAHAGADDAAASDTGPGDNPPGDAPDDTAPGRDTSDSEQAANKAVKITPVVGQGVATADADAATSDGEAAGDKAADDVLATRPKPQPSPQGQPDDALARSEQADDDAVAAQKAKTDAVRAADAAEIKAATKDPASDPDVAAAQARTRAAQNASERADNAAADGDDPWDPNQPNKSAADAFQREVKEAKQAQADAESDFAKQQAADVAAAKAAASQAQAAQDAADAKAAAAHDDVVNARANAAKAASDAARAANPAQAAADDANKAAAAHDDVVNARAKADAATAKADAAAAKAASDAARAANPAQAAADDANNALADAQARENDAFFNKDAQGYRDARAALEAARAKAAAAQAAADAAKSDGSGGGLTAHKKP